METVVLTIHLILALLLIGVVLLQKNEGAALLSGGGNMQARGQATALTKVTWILATAFIITSITLTILATRGAGGGSVIDGTVLPAADGTAPAAGGMMPPPAATGDAPAAPPRADEPAPPPAPETPAGAPAEAPGETPAEPAN